MFESGGRRYVVQHGEVAFLGFGRRDEADGLQKPAIVEPVHPFEGCELDGFEATPRSARRWRTSALRSPLIVSARVLSLGVADAAY